MEKITDEALLLDLTENAASKTTRRLASEKIAEIEHQRNPRSIKEITTQKLNALATEATQLQASPDIDAATLRLVAIKQEWQDLDRENKHPAHSAFSKTCNDIEDRYKEILKRRTIEQEKAARNEELQPRLDEICNIIERLSCATAHDAKATKEQSVTEWTTLLNDPNDKMVPSTALTKRFTHVCQVFDANREKIDLEKELVEVIEKKCAETQELITNHDLKKAAARLVETEKSLAPIKFNFYNKTAIEKLVSNASSNLNQAERDIHNQNLSRRQEICTELERLANEKKHTYIERQQQNLQLWPNRSQWLREPRHRHSGQQR